VRTDPWDFVVGARGPHDEADAEGA
jgi:hypothetical protein